MSTLSIRRSRLERQMALRSTEEFPEGFAVRQGHLAPPLVTPDSPRPQKSEKTAELASTHSLTIPSLQPRQKDGSSNVVRVESIVLETDNKKPRKK